MKRAIYFLAFMMPFIGLAQGGTEIYLLDMKIEGKKISLSNPENITHRKGYDNQPHFATNATVIYYTADFDTAGHTDIKTYDYRTKQTASFTDHTLADEYSPTLTPDKKFISSIVSTKVGVPGKQNLGKYPIKGGDAIILINTLAVGYHAWMDDHRLLIFVLDDSAHNSLHVYNLLTKEDKVIMQNPGRALLKIPGQNAMSFIDKSAGKDWRIKKLDCTTLAVTDITAAIPGQEGMAWTNDGRILMNDGKNIFSHKPGSNTGWQQVDFENNNPLLKGLTRMAVSADNRKLAIVVIE